MGAIAQLVERFVRNEEAGGSIPPGSTTRYNSSSAAWGVFKNLFGPLVQALAGEKLRFERSAGVNLWWDAEHHLAQTGPLSGLACLLILKLIFC